MKGDLPFLRHMLDAVRRVESYLKDVRQDEFLDDPEKQDAVIRQLELIGDGLPRSADVATTNRQGPGVHLHVLVGAGVLAPITEGA